MAKTFEPNVTHTLKTYKRRDIIHVCLGAYCAGLPKTSTTATHDLRLEVLPLLHPKTRELVGAVVTLPDGKKEGWSLLDRRSLKPIAGMPEGENLLKFAGAQVDLAKAAAQAREVAEAKKKADQQAKTQPAQQAAASK